MISATSALLSRRFQRIAQLTSSADRDGILNVFNPNSPTTTPAKFAGRDYALEKLIDALIARGADVVVFGERGSGKSSLANMLHDIARGNLEVLDYYDGLRERLEAGGRLEAFRRLIANALGKRKSPFDVIW